MYIRKFTQLGPATLLNMDAIALPKRSGECRAFHITVYVWRGGERRQEGGRERGREGVREGRSGENHNYTRTCTCKMS